MTAVRATPRIAITPGEPAGIGPDIVLALAAMSVPAELVIIGDPDLLRARANRLGSAFACAPYTGGAAPRIAVEAVRLRVPVTPGLLDRRNSDYVLETLDRAIQGSLSGEFDAMVTGPVQKSVINEAGRSFSGHTEYLAERAGGFQPVMMLVADQVRVALVTTHLPLREVAGAINIARVEYVIRTVARELNAGFDIRQSRIAVCGLNPHAGEGGYLGREDLDIIETAIRSVQAELDVTGPVAADTIFAPEMRARFDAVICMYHDQGLPALKALGFGHAVNVTLGLPFIRTSVDHGTALALAGTGQADPGSLRAAVDLAISLSAHRSAI